MADHIWDSREHALKLTDVVGFEVRCDGRPLGEVAGTTYDREHAFLAVDDAHGRRLVQAGRVRDIDRDNATVHVAPGDEPGPAASPATDELLGPNFGEPGERDGV